MHKLTKEQQHALRKLYLRRDLGMSYLTFRRSAFIAFGDCLMVPWLGMILGIETDGYTHS